MDPDAIIDVRIRPNHDDEYQCSITDMFDLYQIYQSELGPPYDQWMKTYMMPPEDHSGKWYIPFRVPGATRGCIEVIPNGNLWEIIHIEFYKSTAIVDECAIGCYKADVKDLIPSFIGNKINFIGHNPEEESKCQL